VAGAGEGVFTTAKKRNHLRKGGYHIASNNSFSYVLEAVPSERCERALVSVFYDPHLQFPLLLGQSERIHIRFTACHFFC